MALSKIVEFNPPKSSYLAFVSLREKKLLIDFVAENFNIEYSVDEGEVTAVHFQLTNFMLKKIRHEFPNIHIIEGTL